MPQQLEPAIPTQLSSVSPAFVNRKLRLAGWLLHDNTASSVIMIHDGEDALLVDISLCLSAFKTSLWLRESKSLVMVLGYLELCPKALPLPVLHAHAPDVGVNPRLILRAIVAEEARGLDMSLWNRAIQAREDAARASKSET
ncbi:hypothetical protein L226DRAFT_567930 [Lentinus tigrinus ALCF2SS1-7]|uniref:uncharacterized protein n=1 Tax=Lentinus tigrinus ALCF2SS1-7 TaxID=1328758 RepID=UPI001165D993|nr:hypothetical protein L226DRAFT_567930 [Lentinus tigrinus ALCF2SS1-7]